MQNSATKPPSLTPLIVGLFGLIVAFHLGNALAGKSLIRASHLGTALEYARGNINLLRPVIVGFTATESPTALELPLWQAAVALGFKITGSTWYGWANLISLLFFATGLWPFFQLAKHYVGARAAGWSLAFLLAQPLIVIMAGKAATDGFCLALMIWFLFCVDRMIRSAQWQWWIPTAGFACLSALSKLPFFMAAGLAGMAILLLHNFRSARAWFMLTTVGAVATGAFFIWSRHCDLLSAQAEFPYMELRISKSPFIAFWYFGDLHLRLSPAFWIKGGWRFLIATLGSLPLVAVLLAGFFSAGNRLPKLWLLATFLTVLVFTNLVLTHWHYYLMCCPAVAMLCGVTAARWEEGWTGKILRPQFGIALVALAFIGSAVEGIVAMKPALEYDSFPREMSALIRQYTRPEDKLLLYKCDPEWPGEVLFRSGRKGLYVSVVEGSPDGPTPNGLVELLDREVNLNRLRSLGYTKLVLMNESPVRFAVETMNPNRQQKRVYYPATISAKVDAWPVVYRSEDMLIKEIPAAP